MSDTPLFRSEALKARQTQLHGDIILVRPLSTQVFTWVSVLFAAVVLGFLFWGSYTKRSTVSGQLLPDSGLVKVYSPQFGVVREKRVIEGQKVQQGEVLYVLSSERRNGGLGSVQAAIAALLTSRRESLNEEIAQTERFQQRERLALQERIKSSAAELAKLDNLLADQQALLKLSRDRFQRYQSLSQSGHISTEQLQQSEEEVLDQRSRLQSVERDRIRVALERDTRREELAGLDLKHETQLAQLRRSISALDQELTENEATRQIYITAPEAGTATALGAFVGQSVDGDRPIASIVPEGAKMQALLFAPSRAVGFIRVGDPVLLRYQAYPYQKFGHAHGQVSSVAKTALPANELAVLGPVSGSTTNEPLYRISVDLQKQNVLAYGKEQPLQAGMLLQADILQDTRKLYEWVAEPLLSLTGKL